MKKLFSFILGAILAISLFGFSFSDSVLDYLDNIGQDILFGYNPTSKISVEDINSTSINIKSPVLIDEFNDTISDYILLYSQYQLVEVLDNPTLLENMSEKPFFNLDLAGQSNFEMSLTTSDNLDPNTIYYLVSIPKDGAGSLGEVSNELCFRLNDQLHGEGDDCKSGTTNNHGAGANMSLANISHTINGNRLTLRWISVSGSDKIDLFLWDESAATFNKLSTVNMSSESYSFDLTRNGEHIVKFIPNNGGTEINYTFNVLSVSSTTPTPTPTVTPVVVGPKENIIAILIGTVLLYFAYRLVRRKT